MILGGGSAFLGQNSGNGSVAAVFGVLLLTAVLGVILTVVILGVVLAVVLRIVFGAVLGIIFAHHGSPPLRDYYALSGGGLCGEEAP